MKSIACLMVLLLFVAQGRPAPGKVNSSMEEAKSNSRLWAADGLERLDPAPAAREAAITRVVVRMFETYPTRQKPR